MDRDPDIPLRLKRKQTWPDRPNDYMCAAPEHRGSVGHIYRYGEGSRAGEWYWSYQAMLYGVTRGGDCNGVARSPCEAAWEIEER